MAYTQADIDRMKAAMATGELEVQAADGTRVRYQTFEEMRQRIEYIEGQMRAQSAAAGTQRATMYPRFIHSRER